MIIRHTLIKISNLLLKKKRVMQLIHQVNNIANLPSYYPEKSRKDYKTRKKEIISWLKKHGELNHFYTLYGLDIEGSDSSGFIDYFSFMESRNRINQIDKFNSQIVLLRDKFLFFKYMRSNHLPVPEIFAVSREGTLYNADFAQITWECMREEYDYFVKDINGECASFVKHVNDYQELLNLKNCLSKGTYIFQRKVLQCQEMNTINSNALNTLRIVTINKNGAPYVLTSLLRVGTSKTGKVDNWAAGGLAVGINKSGYLKEFGFFKPTYGLKVSEHPDSKIVFSTFLVPMYNEALELACKAHRCFYGIGAIGWDVAITENGPVFIEGNDNWEISLQQACDRPLKYDWQEAIKN